jgi:transposase
MGKTRAAYPPEFRRQMVDLVRAGRSPEELAREFEPTAPSIRNCLAQSERNAGRGDGGLTTAEREELNRLRRENRQLRRSLGSILLKNPMHRVFESVMGDFSERTCVIAF